MPKSKAKAKAKASRAAEDEDGSEPRKNKKKEASEADDSKAPKRNHKPKDKSATDNEKDATPVKKGKGKGAKASCSYVADVLAKSDPDDYEYMVYFATTYGIDKNAPDLRAELRPELPYYESCAYDVYYSKVRKGVGVFLRELMKDGKKMNLGSFGFAQTPDGFLVSAAAAICLATQQ